MSRHKRAADSDLDDEESNGSASSPGSSSQIGSEGRKRRRISDNSDTTPEHEPINLAGPSHVYSDDDLDNDTEQDEDDVIEAATQAIQDKRARRLARNGGNAVKDHGILESVRVFDFMCHRDLEYKLGPRINFIIGKNGSGKSAVLTAIIICLGGKVSSTNRGANLAAFIREGADQARIICKIKNKGDGAYMHDEFGDCIIIERAFTRGGGSSYKIKTSSGRVYSQKRSALDSILDHCDMQIENPLNILHQDAARTFLQSSKPAERYKFFVKGVQLEQLDLDYRLIQEQLENMRVKLERKEGDIGALEARKEQAKEIRELAQRRETIKDKQRDVKRQLVWIQVKTQEDVVQGYTEQISGADEKISESERRVDELDEKYQEADRAHEITRQSLEEVEATLTRMKEEQRELKASYEEAKTDLVNAQAESRVIKDALKRHENTIRTQEQAIAEEEQRLLEVNGGGATRRIQELEAAKMARNQALENWNTHKAAKELREKAIKEATSHEVQMRNDRDARQADVKDQDTKLKALEANKDRYMAAFRPNTEKLLRAIDQETRWTQKPIGPIGRYVRLTKPEWGSILETVFGGALAGFIVFNKRDADLLGRLKKAADCNADLFIMNTLPLTPREPDEQFETVLRVLEFDNEYVKKHLIIQQHIEQRLLIRDLDEANRVMYGGDRLRNVSGCFTMNPHDSRKGHFLKYSSAGTQSMDPVNAYPGMPRMKSDVEATMALRRQALHEAQDRLAAAGTAFTQARASKVATERDLHRHNKRNDELRIEFQQAEDEIERLENAIKDDNVESGRLDQLREGLQEYKDEKDLTEGQFKDAYAAQTAKKDEMRARNARLTEFDTEVADVQKKRAEAHSAHIRTDQKRAHDLHEKNNAQARVQDAKDEKAKWNDRKQEAENTLAGMTEQARNYSERVNLPEGATRETLATKLERLKQEERRFNREVGLSMAEATEELTKAQNAFKQAKKDYEQLGEMSEMLKSSLADRRRRWEIFRSSIKIRAQIKFIRLLSERGFRGELLISHKQQLLDIKIEPDITKRSGAGRNAKTLSGGEKSFSQICMLLSMWDAMGSPLRCLDEFDVFMDAVNRSQSVKMIIEAARESEMCQFILISPGSKRDIPREADVMVQEFGEPERGQLSLNETMGLEG